MTGKSPQKIRTDLCKYFCRIVFTFVGFPETTLFTGRLKGKAPHIIIVVSYEIYNELNKCCNYGYVLLSIGTTGSVTLIKTMAKTP